MPPASTPAQSRKHTAAVLGVLLAASIWGGSFAAMKFALQAHLSVGLMLTLRFSLGTLCLGLLMLALRVPVRRRAVADGLWLGLLISAIFWLQADGLRFTSTAKSGFITGLYVLFTPLISVLLGRRLRLAHGLGAVVAAGGLFLLVHDPAAASGGWNRGDSQTLVCSALCGLHIVLTGHFSRRSSGWVLAATQMAVVALLSLGITALLPGPFGFQGAARALSQPAVWITLGYLGLLASAAAFFLMMTCQAHLGATEASILYTLEPLFTALLAMSGWVPGIKEHLSPRQLLGGAIIIGAMILAEVGPRIWRTAETPLPAGLEPVLAGAGLPSGDPVPAGALSPPFTGPADLEPQANPSRPASM
jgi:drug/metabolite transporter (DMT)-like permease